MLQLASGLGFSLSLGLFEYGERERDGEDCAGEREGERECAGRQERKRERAGETLSRPRRSNQTRLPPDPALLTLLLFGGVW